MAIDLNCDMGEAYSIYTCGDDKGIMPYITVANVACGFHASDPAVMHRTVALAKEHGVRVGAHPSYPDRDGFGRRKMDLDPTEVMDCILYQVGALKGFLEAEGLALNHVKPHGALYGVAWRDEGVARAIARATKVFGVPLYGMSGTGQEQWYVDEGAEVIWETYVDLDYNDQAEVIITRQHDPVTPEIAVDRAVLAARDKRVKSQSGSVIDVRCDTICVHSDTPGAIGIARAVREAVQPYMNA